MTGYTSLTWTLVRGCAGSLKASLTSVWCRLVASAQDGRLLVWGYIQILPLSALWMPPPTPTSISCFSWMGPSSLPQRRAVLIGGASIDLVLSRAVYLGASRPFGRKELLGREGPGALLCRVSTCLRVELGGEGKLGLGPAPVVWAGWEPDRGLGVWLEQTPYGWREWLPGAISGIPGLQVLGSD